MVQPNIRTVRLASSSTTLAVRDLRALAETQTTLLISQNRSLKFFEQDRNMFQFSLRFARALFGLLCRKHFEIVGSSCGERWRTMRSAHKRSRTLYRAIVSSRCLRLQILFVLQRTYLQSFHEFYLPVVSK